MKRVIVSIIIIAVVVGAFYYLKDYFDKEDVDTWDLVPKNAMAVYEVTDPADVWKIFTGLPVWDNLSTIPPIRAFNTELDKIDTLSSGNKDLSALLSGTDLFASFHKISNSEIGVIFFVEIGSTDKRKILNDILTYFDDLPDARYSVRNFHDMDIHEINFTDKGKIFSYLQFKNYFIASFTPFLIDDVIRNISSGFSSNFRTEISGIFQFKPLETDQGNLYINLTRMPELVESLTDPADRGSGRFLSSLAGSAYYDVSFEGNQIFLNGSAFVPPGNDEYFLSTFYNQEPQQIRLISYLPNLTATFLAFTFSEFSSWEKSANEYWQANLPAQLEKKSSFFRDKGIHEDEFYDWFGNEIGLATLKSINIDHPDKLFFIASPDPDSGTVKLDDLTESLNQANGDTLLYELYGDRVIKKLGMPEFPSVFFGDAFLGFESSYYTSIDGYIVIGNSFDVIKMMLNDLEQENTWGKSLNFIRFFENVQKKANLSYFVNFSNEWNSFYGALNNSWKDFFKKYDYQFKHFELVSFQFSNINNHLYSSAALQHRPKTNEGEAPATLSRDQVVVTANPIITKPFVVKNHLDRSLEVVLQDSAGYLYLISSQGKVLWQDSIGQKIRGELFQLDFYNNGKLQYFFSSDKGLHVIDRNGDYVEGFPVNFGEPIDVEWVNLIDYDNSKQYRILLADSSGKIYLFNKYGEPLDGWDPREFGGRFSSSPFHIRIGARDCMIAVEEKGAVNLMTRRGDFYKGFPEFFNQQITGPVFIQRGTDFNRTLIHVVLENGEINKCNLEGDIVEKIQLYRPGPESNFEIVEDVLNNSYIVSRQDYNNVCILGPDGDIIFEKELLFSDKLKVQYYNFSAGNEIYAFTDGQQGFTYLFDGNGTFLHQQPVENSFRIGLVYSEVNNKYQLYSCYGNQFSLSSFYRK